MDLIPEELRTTVYQLSSSPFFKQNFLHRYSMNEKVF